MCNRLADRPCDLLDAGRAAWEVHDQGSFTSARESIQLGVCACDAARIASLMPGTERSITEAVASGVTSLGAMPVPPVVSTRAQSLLCAQPIRRAAHRLADAWDRTLDHRGRGLRRDVAWRNARAAGGQHQSAVAPVRPAGKAAFDRWPVVRDHLASDDLGAEALGEVLQAGAAEVLADAGRLG